MAEKTVIERAQIVAAAKAGDGEAFMRLEAEQEASRAEAIERGLRDSTLSTIERAGIKTLVGLLVDACEEVEMPEASVLRLCESWATMLAEDPIRAKIEVAYNLDADAAGGESAPGGILDRALDDVIATLIPYAERRGGWYKIHAPEAEMA